MDGACFVSGGESIGNLLAGGAGFGDGEGAALADEAGEVGAVDEFHDEVGRSGDAAGVGGHHDAWVMQTAQHLNFAFEAAARFGGGGESRAEDFQGYDAIELPMAGAVDHAHAAAAED